MSKSNEFLLLLMILLSVSSPKSLVFSSPVHKQGFNRADPLRYFKPYKGDYDIRNRHYWASAAFTGVHGYAVAGIWILGGLGFGIFAIFKNRSCGSSSLAVHSDSYHFIPFLVILIFTLLAIVASGLVLAANQNSFWRTKKLKQTLFGAIREARHTITNVTRAMEEMQQLLHPYNNATSSQLRSQSRKLQRDSQNLQRIEHKNRISIDRAIKTWHGATAGVVSINLIFVLATFVLLLLEWRPGFIMIISLCWILTALCWVLTGFHFFLHTFAEDTCSAFKEFQQNPNNNSLISVLPCVDQVYADHIMIEIGSTVHKFINKVNSKITGLSELLGLGEQSEDSQSKYWKICNPFSGAPYYSYDPNRCAKDVISISDIPIILARFTCYKENSTESCEVGKKFISETNYNMAWAYTRTIQGLINVLPDLKDLTQCSIVKETFSDILSHQCRPFRVSFKLLWSSMIFLSIVMVILELAWLATLYQNLGRSFSRCLVIPRLT